ncbi:hypothetical protein KIN20_025278 [Parelaphostrongylus tenuis]|uniref:Uncharacterized protein n=1 Tax=Parelaphostrongylus tenuis TaxID=148309 RepID=A0AAD5NBR7_PARTN|nr:hypothetical protein KIN20_025278 [Parelaphostrongylus tenuis]
MENSALVSRQSARQQIIQVMVFRTKKRLEIRGFMTKSHRNCRESAAELSFQPNDLLKKQRNKIILTNKAGTSSAPFMILLLVSISTVFGCGVIPGGQTSTRTFTASGPSNLPIIAVYTDMNQVSALIPGIATSKGAVQALAQRFAMQTVIDVLEIEGRRALLPDFVISNILGQLHVNTTYEPLLCQSVREPGLNQDMNLLSCIIVGGTVTGMCPAKNPPGMTCQMVATAIDGKHLTLSGTLTTTNIIMANWPVSMWQNVVDRALRLLRSGPFGSHLYTVTVTVS